ncbi:class I SAM-dependent methyltransferase [Nonomuraea sp. NPDC003214]
MPTTTSWIDGRSYDSPFTHPVGWVGRMAGRFMLWTNRHQKEILPLVAAGPGQRVLEIGYGAGGLARLLCATGARVCGVDPSPDMRLLAARRAPAADLRLGTASDTGFPDRAFDRVVSVNTVAIWPELAPAVRELHRVTRPGGRALIAWHGGSAPSRVARGLRMSDADLDRVRAALGDVFDRVDREELSGLTVFVAHR